MSDHLLMRTAAGFVGLVPLRWKQSVSGSVQEEYGECGPILFTSMVWPNLPDKNKEVVSS